MTDYKPLVSIIIVNWNGKGFLEKNLVSVFDQTCRSFEVVLVDNGSSDYSIDFVKDNFPQVTIIENSENLGFAAANNQGIKAARGKYIATLNNDTVVHMNWLRNLLDAAEASEREVCMWAPKILTMGTPPLIDSVGGLVLYRDGVARGKGRGEIDDGQYDGCNEVLFPSACSALYLKEMLDEVGLFDEGFFAYCEDTDLGLRARLAGWKACSVPDAIVYHHYSGTAGKYSATKAFFVERNHIWLVIKNLPLSMIFQMPFYTVWRWAVQAVHLIAGKGATSSYIKNESAVNIFLMLIYAFMSAIKGVPKMLEKRKDIQKCRVVSKRDVKRWFVEFGVSAREVVDK